MLKTWKSSNVAKSRAEYTVKMMCAPWYKGRLPANEGFQERNQPLGKNFLLFKPYGYWYKLTQIILLFSLIKPCSDAKEEKTVDQTPNQEDRPIRPGRME